MLKSSNTIALVLISSITVLWGFKSCLDIRRHYNEFSDNATTQPSGGRSSHFFWGGGSYRSGSGGGGSGMHSGTSRGGFGGSGHAASS